MKPRNVFALLFAPILILAGCGGTAQVNGTQTPAQTPATPSATQQDIVDTAPLQSAPSTAAPAHELDISFEYEKQEGMASNQFAIWVEDASGKHVHTIYATDFTAAKGGWQQRENSLRTWVARFGAAEASQQDIEAVSGATPISGKLMFSWDCTIDGEVLPDGEYVVLLEATLRDENYVLYKANISTTGSEQQLVPEAECFGGSDAEHGMIGNVRFDFRPAQ